MSRRSGDSGNRIVVQPARSRGGEGPRPARVGGSTGTRRGDPSGLPSASGWGLRGRGGRPRGRVLLLQILDDLVHQPAAVDLREDKVVDLHALLLLRED